MAASHLFTSDAIQYTHGSSLRSAYPVFISCWLMIPNGPSDGRVFMNVGKTYVSTAGIKFKYLLTGTALAYRVSDVDVLQYTISQNIWYHFIGASRSQTDHELYLNGVSVGTDTTDVGSLGTNERITFGSQGASSQPINNGNVCWGMLGSDSMTDAFALEIALNANFQPPGVIGYWPLVKDISVAADGVDIGPNGYNMDTITNSPTPSLDGPPVQLPQMQG